MNNRKIGLIIIGLGIVFSISFAILWNELQKEIKSGAVIDPVSGECIHDQGDQCPFVRLNELNPLLYLGIVASVLLFAFAIYLIIKPSASKRGAGTVKVKEVKELKLDDEEKKVYDLIREADGSIFQSDLVEKTGLSKVKVTRILDKLEGRKVIERKRRGMTNIVILKN